jgi:signal transduction histidine kinase
VSSVLDLADLESGAFKASESVFDLADILADAAKEACRHAASERLRVTVQVRELPAALVGDPARIRQALANYLSNAVKFTDTGEIAVRAMIEAESPHSVLARLEVEDSGPGIPPDVASRLFADFVQGDDSLQRRRGLGIGLVITKRLAEAMGGSAGLVGSQGKGSLFWLTVRLRRVATCAAESDRASPALPPARRFG